LLTPTLPITLDCFGEIGFTAIHDKDPSRNTIALTFLSALNNRGGFIQPHSASQRMKQLPEIQLHTPIDIVSWQPPERDDPFDRIANLPPLTIIDIEYLGCAFQRPISNLVQLVKVEPLSSWSRAMFRAEALQIQYVDEGQISPVQVSPDYTVLFKAFEETLGAVEAQVATEPADEEVVGLQSEAGKRWKKGSKEEEKKEEEELDDSDFRTSAPKEGTEVDALEFLTIASSAFLPPKPEVEALGADSLLQGFKIAPLFPATLR
jgi:hypothetical protein